MNQLIKSKLGCIGMSQHHSLWRAMLAGILLLAQALQPSFARAQSTSPWSVTFDVQTPAYTLSADSVQVAGYEVNLVPGAPVLPVWSTVIELPSTGDYQVTYQSLGSQTLPQQIALAAASVPDTITFQADQTGAELAELPSVAPVLDKPDPAIYAVNALYPASLAIAGDVQWQRGQRLLPLRVFPFQYNPVTHQLQYHPHISVKVTTIPGEARQQPIPAVSTHNPAASTAGALRIRTGSAGMFRLTYADLQTAGVDLAQVNPATFAMSYLGQPIAIEVVGEEDGHFDSGDLVVFYAQRYVGRYGAQNTYWLTYGGAAGLRMDARTVTPTGSEPVVTTITQTVRIERNSTYYPSYQPPQDADHWFDDALSVDQATGVSSVTRNYTLPLDDPLSTGTVQIHAALHGGADRPANPDKSVALYLNGHLATTHQWEGKTYTEFDVSAPAEWLAGSNQISLVAALDQLPGIQFYLVSPDWLEVAYPALAQAEGDKLFMEGVAEGANKIVASGFTTSDISVYDLRNPNQPVRIMSKATVPETVAYTLSFWDANLPDPAYYLSSYAALLAPAAIQPDTPSSWQNPNHTADYIAIVHSSLWSAIDPLLAHRANEGMTVAKVDVQDIYDEWSYGRLDPEAIRSFLSYAYHNWNAGGEPPRYVVLVGDGTNDPLNVIPNAVANLIPPYHAYVDPWLGEIPVDNRYVSVDGPDDNVPDMVIGRISALTPDQVTNVVNKVIAYETTAPAGDWQRRVVFVADNNSDPAGQFHVLSDDIRNNWLPSGYDASTIYYKAGSYTTAAAMRTAIKTAINNDALMVQWFGHGNVIRWGSVDMFNNTDVDALAANDTWPVIVAYTCLNAYFHYSYPAYPSFGEVLVRASQRGAVAAIGGAGYELGSSLSLFNRGIADAVFQQRTERAGDAFYSAKQYYFANATSFLDVIDSITYFGDPALKLRLPESPLNASDLTFDLTASRDWAPSGMPISVTAHLTNTGLLDTGATFTINMPTGLTAPTQLMATAPTVTYNAGAQQVLWDTSIAPEAAEQASFTTSLTSAQAVCSTITVTGQVIDDLNVTTNMTATLNLVVPDVDCDSDVDILDIQQITARWGANVGDATYHPRYDLDGDDTIGVQDIIADASHWSAAQ